MLGAFREVLRYRELVGNLVRRDLKVRYKGSILGFLWYLVHPLLIMIILSVVFSHLFRDAAALEAYPVYLLTALLCWNLFNQAILNSSVNLASSGSLIRKVYVPKTVFPLASVGGSLTNFLLSLIPLFLVALHYAVPLGWPLLFLPVGVGLLLTFSVGMALLVSGLNVFYRDIHHIAEVVLVAWFYLTPVIWPAEMIAEMEIPRWVQILIAWNPLAAMIECVRAPIHAGTLPDRATILWAGLCAFGALAVGVAVFRRLEGRFIYHL